MLTIHTNSLSLITQRNLAFSSKGVKTSIERLSTGFKINRAADNASNLSISKKMNCQISGTSVAQENTQQAIGLLDTADGTLDEMTKIANRIRDLSLQSMNGTYSDEERAMMQEEVNKLTLEMYRQRNSAKYNELDIFGKDEYLPNALNSSIAGISGGGGSLEALSNGVFATSIQPTGANLDPATLGPQGTVGTYEVEKLTEEEALAQGYTVIKTADDLAAIPHQSKLKYCLVNDIDLSGINWNVTQTFSGEFNGNGYAINNLTGSSGLFNDMRGTVKNLTLNNVNIQTDTQTVGAIAGINRNGVIENCKVSGSIKSTTSYVGLIAGNSSGRIINCETSGYVESAGSAGGVCGAIVLSEIINSKSSATVVNGGMVGGLLGILDRGSVINCEASGNVNASGDRSGGLVGSNCAGTIKDSAASGNVVGAGYTGGFVGYSYNHNSGTKPLLENVVAIGTVTATGNFSGSLVGENQGTIKNASASGDVSGTGYVGGFVGYAVATSTIENASATGNVTATGNNSGGLVGNNSGSIKNASAMGNVSGREAGGFVGTMSASGLIENCSASGNVNANGIAGGFIVAGGGTIKNSYSLGNVKSETDRVGGFIGQTQGITIINSYAKGDVSGTGYAVGGFVGYANGKDNLIENSYSTGNVSSGTAASGFVAYGGNKILTIKNSYSTGTVNKGQAFGGGENLYVENCYSNSEQPSGVTIDSRNGVTAMPSSWFEDGENLRFLGNAYDYYYNPPELWGNYEKHPEEFTQFQVGANSGEKNQLEMNMTFRMYNFYGDVSSVESASDTLERVDAFKERLSEHRSMIGAVRNRLDSVLESQSIRLENLNSSYSTIVDTDFAAETAALTRNQILQQATTSLLAQANMMPNIALQLLS